MRSLPCFPSIPSNPSVHLPMLLLVSFIYWKSLCLPGMLRFMQDHVRFYVINLPRLVFFTLPASLDLCKFSNDLAVKGLL